MIREFRFKFAILVIVVLFTLKTQAQSWLHKFDAQKLQSVQEIKAALTNASVDQVVSSVRSNLDYLSGKELDIVSKETKLVRDLSVFALLTTTNNAVNYLDGQLIEPRLLQIFGDTNHVEDASGDINDYEQRKHDIAAVTRRFQIATGQSPPAFSFAKDYPATLDPEFTNKLSRSFARQAQFIYQTLTNEYAGIKPLYFKYSTNTGDLADVLRQIKALEENEAQKEASDEVVKKKLASAITAYTNAIGTNANSQVLATNVLNLMDSMTNMLAKGGPLAKKIGLQVQYDAVNAVISAAASGTISTNLNQSTNANLSVATKIASHLPGLVKDVSDMNAFARELPVSGLLLNRQLLELQLEEVNNEMALNEKRRAYTYVEVDALIMEAKSLFKSRSSLTGDGAFVAEFKTNSFGTLLSNKNVSGPKRAALVGAMLNYTASIQIGQQTFYRNQTLVVQLEYENATLISEQALLQWKALVDVPINQLLDYYSTGFKSEEVAKTVVNALGLAAIAWRL